ncbi:MAG: macro domain-containing protein [Pseudomonadota bacterium]
MCLDLDEDVLFVVAIGLGAWVQILDLLLHFDRTKQELNDLVDGSNRSTIVLEWRVVTKMIIYHRTSLMTSSAQTVVNTVNCVGVMGKGIAEAFKKRHPTMFKSYKKICDQKLLEPGKLWLWRGPEQWVLNFPTKKHWRSPSKLEWVESGLEKFVRTYEEQGIKEIAFPKLGCGNGNLDWKVVQPLMEKYLDKLSIPVFVHDFEVDFGLPEHIEAVVSESLQLPAARSFDEAWVQVQQVSNRVGPSMLDFETKQPFRWHAANDTVLIETESERFFFEKEELSEIWRILTNGMLTKRKLGLSQSAVSSRLISLISLLPSVRPIQIQEVNSETGELAAEMRYRSGSEEPGAEMDQMSLSWH